jgi:uncharacterized protein YndB with AHSA1/START domain
MTQPTVAHDTFVIERIYDVPVVQAFQAWTDPELKARWFVGSATDALKAGYRLDFRVGGHEFFRGGRPDGPVHTYDSEFRDIVPDQRIVYTYEMFADDDRISVSVATVEFRSQGSATHLVLTEQGAYLDGRDTSAQREEGTQSFLGALGTFLEADKS